MPTLRLLKPSLKTSKHSSMFNNNRRRKYPCLMLLPWEHLQRQPEHSAWLFHQREWLSDYSFWVPDWWQEINANSFSPDFLGDAHNSKRVTFTLMRSNDWKHRHSTDWGATQEGSPRDILSLHFSSALCLVIWGRWGRKTCSLSQSRASRYRTNSSLIAFFNWID